ncbi:glycosyltransferase involved in cell wall biosynthesis [Catalinimonas alkaloidigena]|uniref:glycosyltransferase family 2 protein n=1 Tax=Catalinimonas alkaloidigena TaxID=1075417 RepID=UPI002406C7C8|nr:glycosyltransferase [Catalinimonas alkaloidigena]MDF9798021.1 glycosyltransferase involved in cell wall biosynthesis [Catalinimonas alkaloidigena]
MSAVESVMDHQVLVSVYITNYNYGKYITQAVESVLQQTLDDFEIIIIDDGSTDNSREIIEDYARHPKIKVIFQKNKGLNVTNNIALRVAKGKYIMRLDADDFLDQNALLVMSNTLERDPELGLVFPDYYITDESGDPESIHKRHDFDKDVSLLDQAAHGACTMIRSSFLRELGGYNEDYSCQDGYELWVKFTAQHKVSNINTPLFYYRQHGSNLTKNETRILTTRATINKDYLKADQEKQQTIAIIPVRDANSVNNKLAFTLLDDKTFLEHKIDQAVLAENICQVIVSSPDEKVKQFVMEKYQNQVSFISRPSEQARLNVGLVGTVNHIMTQEVVSHLKPTALAVLAIEFPFVDALTLDNAINTLFLFNSDSLISVRPDTHLFFQHHGHGMQPILNQDKFTKLERESLFKYTGGISVTKTTKFREEQQFITGKVGHVVIDQQASLGIFSEYDLKVARLLAKHSLAQA